VGVPVCEVRGKVGSLRGGVSPAWCED